MRTELERKTKTTLLKRANILRSSNFEFHLNTTKAYSYSWWLFVTKFKGKIIINNSSYSATTNKHQAKALQILDYKYDLTLRYTRKSLENLEDALKDELKGAKAEIDRINALRRKPRTHAKKNEERMREVIRLTEHCEKVDRYIASIVADQVALCVGH